MIDLPPIINLNHFNSFDEFLLEANSIFVHDFIQYPPSLKGTIVKCNQDKMPQNGHFRTFWHLITEGDHREEDRICNDRVERIPWINPIISGQPDEGWWMWEKPAKRNNRRILIYSCKYKYLVVIEKRGESRIVFWTAYPIGVENDHQERKLKTEYLKYCIEKSQRPQ